MKYFVLSEEDDDTSVYTDSAPATVRKKYQLKKGYSRAGDWPNEALFKYSEIQPDGIQLRDYVGNGMSLLIISDTMKSLLEQMGAQDIEFLPIQFADHRGRPVSDDYYIANIVTLTEVVDRNRSDFDVDAADDSMISNFRQFVLRKDTAETGPLIARMGEDYQLILFREDLVSEIVNGKLTGMTFTDTESYVSYPT